MKGFDTILTSAHTDSKVLGRIVWLLSINTFTGIPLNYRDVFTVHSCTPPRSCRPHCSGLPPSGEWASLPNDNLLILEQCLGTLHLTSEALGGVPHL